jgi:hypothetical protein
MGWSGTQSIITEAPIGLLYQPQMMMGDGCGAVGEMIGRGNRSTRIRHAPVPLCLPHDVTRARMRAIAVGSRRPIA